MRAPQVACLSKSCSNRNDESDRTLIDLIARGNERALNKLHARYRQRIARFVTRFTASPDIVEEITSDTVWAVWKGAHHFRGSSKVSTWIFGIARHLSHRAINKRSRDARADEPHPLSREAHEPHIEDETSEWVAAALALLPSAQRVALELAYLSGFSCEEISQRINCPVNTVKTRMFHGRRNMRHFLVRLAPDR